jgi:hypothetical protein
MWRFASRCCAIGLRSSGIEDIGLRTDGRFALVFSREETGIVWDVQGGCVRRLLDIQDVQVVDRYLERQGFLNMNYGVGAGKYRLLGFNYKFALPEHAGNCLGIAVDGVLQKLTLYATTTRMSVATLSHETVDADSAIVSFADDGKTLAVVERSYAAFFTNVEDTTG